MIKYVCDRCGKELDKSYRAHISYSGNNEADFCKECNEEFLSWMENKPAEDKPVKEYEKNIIEDYEKAIHNYQQQIIDLTEKLDKTRASRDWWKTQCNEFYKDYKVLSEKLENMLLHGSDAE